MYIICTRMCVYIYMLIYRHQITLIGVFKILIFRYREFWENPTYYKVLHLTQFQLYCTLQCIVYGTIYLCLQIPFTLLTCTLPYPHLTPHLCRNRSPMWSRRVMASRCTQTLVIGMCVPDASVPLQRTRYPQSPSCLPCLLLNSKPWTCWAGASRKR